ncbi:hypothetical protein D3C86_1990710 [compost metagenome]
MAGYTKAECLESREVDSFAIELIQVALSAIRSEPCVSRPETILNWGCRGQSQKAGFGW